MLAYNINIFYKLNGVAIQYTGPVNATDEFEFMTNDPDTLLCIVHVLASSPVTVTA
jgi:hypothetical protein